MVTRFEITKDTVQVVTESAASHIGRIATIVSGAVREVTQEVGEWASDVFEMRDAAAKAREADANPMHRTQ
jgi:hypothetical protein